ncbi:hypothetical protein SEA_BATTUTA_269 [Streptomyces phage Battuta]|uniref:Uncharacterized protein n=1 Tax=Streptomyces phage Battuta TaxID=2805843 RepID=A0A890UUM0_9CAUD|nr:hypothetical protein SEA_BATTUTA_12 [Streptomyces phage Battuta]QRI45910.1 hypothetical protein SEA_BATTUTA_269 [Streptomyces phage Battuta]
MRTHVTVLYADRDQPVKFRVNLPIEEVKERLYSKVAVLEEPDGTLYVINFEKVDQLEIRKAY